MNSRALIIASCWFAVALISSVYIWVALGGGFLGDILFGLFVPIGLLILVALAVTFTMPVGFEPNKKDKILRSEELDEIKLKLDVLTKEVGEIKKAIEE